MLKFYDDQSGKVSVEFHNDCYVRFTGDHFLCIEQFYKDGDVSLNRGEVVRLRDYLNSILEEK